MKKYKIGYTQGVYDMFHVGHLRLLQRAKEQCEYLIVGVNSDKLVQNYKNKIPVVHEEERMEIVENIRCVDCCVLVDTLDKSAIWEKLHFDAIFIGDDWRGTPRWLQTEREMEQFGCTVVYLPYTKGICSTELRQIKERRIQEV